MFQGKTFLAVIPVRGGSKGIPRKNIKPLAGRPLVAWTIEAAKQSEYLDRCVVSTEDAEIKTVAEAWGGEVLDRPEELARDDTPGVEPILHAISVMQKYDYVVVLQATSPLRGADDIDACIRQAIEKNAPCCVSVTEAGVSPFWMYKRETDDRMQPLIALDKEQWYQRQKLPKVYQLNGAVYVVDCDYVRENRTVVGNGFTGYIMPKERSYDIDEPVDFLICEHFMKERKLHV